MGDVELDPSGVALELDAVVAKLHLELEQRPDVAIQVELAAGCPASQLAEHPGRQEAKLGRLVGQICRLRGHGKARPAERKDLRGLVPARAVAERPRGVRAKRAAAPLGEAQAPHR